MLEIYGIEDMHYQRVWIGHDPPNLFRRQWLVKFNHISKAHATLFFSPSQKVSTLLMNFLIFIVRSPLEFRARATDIVANCSRNAKAGHDISGDSLITTLIRTSLLPYENKLFFQTSNCLATLSLR